MDDAPAIVEPPSTQPSALSAEAPLAGSIAQYDADDEPEEKTRIGVPAYEASAKMATEPLEEPEPEWSEPSLRTAQAVRVIVWRGPDGVHVAPVGTRVSAIAIDAILVALDPSADLAAWLTRK